MKDYQQIAREKRSQRDALIPAEWAIDATKYEQNNVLDAPRTCGLLSEAELEITSRNDAIDIVEKIASGTYSAEEVAVAFCKRAAIAQQLTNCLTEIMFTEAIGQARYLDEERHKNPQAPLRPLHGLPISLKDSFKVPGRDATTGLIALVGETATTYSALPQLLHDLGAILYCKTNVPQTMMTADSENNTFGRTLNPNNRTLTSGGSTGGEGALIALRGSLIGIGTDIGGSIRIPSVCNGIYGFKPSADIFPYGGQTSVSLPGKAGITPVAGPMATSIRACQFLTRTVMEARPWVYDAQCMHLAWCGLSIPTRLRIGLVEDDGMFTPWPPVRRNLLETAKKLREAGIVVVPIKIPSVVDAIGVIMQMFSLDGSQFKQSLIHSSGEPEVPSVQKVGLARIPESTLRHFFELNAQRQEIQAAYHKLWLDNKLDALLVPGAPNVATKFNEWDPITYTALWNLLDYPAVILPTGMLQPSDAADDAENARYGRRDVEFYQKYTGPADYAEAPLTVQVVGMRQEDEKLIQIAAKLDRAINGGDQRIVNGTITETEYHIRSTV